MAGRGTACCFKVRLLIRSLPNKTPSRHAPSSNSRRHWIMSSITWPALLQLLGKWALVIVCAMLLSLLWSYLAPPLVRLLTVTAQLFRNATEAISGRLVQWFGDRLGRYVAARRREPRRPTLVGLEELQAAIEVPLQAVVHDIRVLERDLQRTTDTAARLTPGGPPTGLGPLATTLSPEAMAASPWGVIGTLLAATLVGSFNATLLNIFFGELFGSVRLLPYPMPNLQLSLALGIIFFLLEIFVGHLLGQSQDVSDDSRTGSFMRGFVPWFGLIVLASVETAAYALLSKQINLAARLSLDPGSPLYGLATYFLAFLGAGITLILAGLGYAASRQWERYRATSVERAAFRAIKDGAKASATHEERLEDVESALQRVRDAVEAVPKDVSRRASDALGGPPEGAAVLAIIKDHLASMLPRDDLEAARPLRTVAQVFSDLGVQIFLGIVSALGFIAMVALYRQVLMQGASLPSDAATAIGSIVTLGIMALGFFLRDARSGGRRSTIVRHVAAAASGRSLWAITALLGLIVMAVTTGIAASRISLLGSSPALNSAFGFGLALMVGMLGGVVDLIIVGAIDAMLLAWLGMAWMLGRAIQLLGVLGELLLHLVRFAAHVLAVPGGWLRRQPLNA